MSNRIPVFFLSTAVEVTTREEAEHVIGNAYGDVDAGLYVATSSGWHVRAAITLAAQIDRGDLVFLSAEVACLRPGASARALGTVQELVRRLRAWDFPAADPSLSELAADLGRGGAAVLFEQEYVASEIDDGAGVALSFVAFLRGLAASLGAAVERGQSFVWYQPVA